MRYIMFQDRHTAELKVLEDNTSQQEKGTFNRKDPVSGVVTRITLKTSPLISNMLDNASASYIMQIEADNEEEAVFNGIADGFAKNLDGMLKTLHAINKEDPWARNEGLLHSIQEKRQVLQKYLPAA